MRKFAFMLMVLFAVLLPLTGLAADRTALESHAVDGVLLFSAPDESFQWWLDARVYLDTAFYLEDRNSLGDGAQLRRARMAWKTILWQDWYAEVDLDFSGEQAEVKDAYIRYDNICGRQGHLRVGNFRVPFGLEENTSSRRLRFMERSQGTEPFVPGRRMGLEFARWADRWRLAVAAFGPDVADYETQQLDVNLNLAGRFSGTPILDDERTLHLGAAAAWRQPTYAAFDGAGGPMEFRTRNEHHVSDFRHLDTGNIMDIDDLTQFGFEAAYVQGRFSAQAEYITNTVRRVDGLDDLNFGGGYAFASFFLTDDTHPYMARDGEFGRVIPNSERGALEASVRFSTTDLSDADVLAGESTAWTAGLTWYANPNVKIYANYTTVDNDENATGDGMVGNDDYGVFQMRFMAAF